MKSKTVSTEIRTGVSCRATKKRSGVLAEAATAQRSEVSEPSPEINAAVALHPKRTKFYEELDCTIGVLDEKSNKTKIQTQSTKTEMETLEAPILKCGSANVCSNTHRYNVSDTFKLEPESVGDPEVLPKIESQMCSSFSNDRNVFTQDFLPHSISYEPETEAKNCAPDSSSGFDEDERPTTPDFTSLAEENTVLLPDNDTESQNQTSRVKCGMCETQLMTAEEEKNHLDNCWVHNKSRHIYCVRCNIKFKYPLHLQEHQQRIHNEATNEFNSDKYLVPVKEDSDDEDDIDESADLYNLPLGEWIKKRRKRFPDLILLHPDPTDPLCILWNDTLTCILCNTYLGSDHIAKDHVKTCWAFNKDNHVHCHLCQDSLNRPGQLRSHNYLLHPFKSLPFPSIFCFVCHEEFQSYAALRKHADSMAEFFQAMTAKESLLVKKIKRGVYVLEPSQGLVNTNAAHNKTGEGRGSVSAASRLIQTEGRNPGNGTQSMTDRHEFEREDKQKYPDALKNVNLLEHSHSDKLQSVIWESGGRRCKLCLQLLGSESHMKLHLENCWLHNKGRHIYCISCQTHFQHPRALKFHNLREHAEERNESVTNLTTVDEAGSNSSVDPELLALDQWIKMRRRDYGDVIQFDPDPTLKKNKNIIISYRKPIICKLCKSKFQSKKTVKDHAKICWFHNKQRHRFCVPCQTVYAKPDVLQNHIRNHHLEIFPRPSFYCMECEQAFLTYLKFKTHEESREEFFKGVREAIA